MSQGITNQDRETIIKGTPIENSQLEYPYVVSLLERNWKNQAWHTCGGSMITPNVILTVAHCYYNVDIAHIAPKLADHVIRNRKLRRRTDNSTSKIEVQDKSQEEGEQEKINRPLSHSFESDPQDEVERTLAIKINNLKNKYFGKAYAIKTWHKYPHPDFDPQTGENDIMLIKLPIWTNGIPTIRLNQDNDFPEPLESSKLAVLGWGVTEATSNQEDSLAEILQSATLRSITNQVCAKRYEPLFGLDVIKDSMICAYSSDGQDACSGDSGKELVLKVYLFRWKNDDLQLILAI